MTIQRGSVWNAGPKKGFLGKTAGYLDMLELSNNFSFRYVYNILQHIVTYGNETMRISQGL